MKLVDAIPSECGCNRKRRRPTVATEETGRSLEDELAEVIVVALSEDSQSECADEDRDQLASTPCITPPSLEMEEVMDLSMEKLLRGSSCCSTSSSRLAALLEENQHALQLLLAKDEARLNEPETASCSMTSSLNKEAWNFELRQSLPGAVAMLLYCIAHASTYELVSNLAYEAVERGPGEDGTYGHPWRLYSVMLILGCLLARFSGLVWNFAGPLAYERVKLIYHNRIRLGARDARWLHWLNDRGDDAVGAVHLVAFYLCYISVVFFVGQLAMRFDQREDILGQLPSLLYKNKLAAIVEGAANVNVSDNHMAGAFLRNGSAGIGDWVSLNCLEGREELEIFGPEDDLYFFRTLSKNSYDHFFGQEFETALFDSTHQIFFYATLDATTIFALKRYLGFSFWAGW